MGEGKALGVHAGITGKIFGVKCCDMAEAYRDAGNSGSELRMLLAQEVVIETVCLHVVGSLAGNG